MPLGRGASAVPGTATDPSWARVQIDGSRVIAKTVIVA